MFMIMKMGAILCDDVFILNSIWIYDLLNLSTNCLFQILNIFSSFFMHVCRCGCVCLCMCMCVSLHVYVCVSACVCVCLCLLMLWVACLSFPDFRACVFYCALFSLVMASSSDADVGVGIGIGVGSVLASMASSSAALSSSAPVAPAPARVRAPSPIAPSAAAVLMHDDAVVYSSDAPSSSDTPSSSTLINATAMHHSISSEWAKPPESPPFSSLPPRNNPSNMVMNNLQSLNIMNTTTPTPNTNTPSPLSLDSYSQAQASQTSSLQAQSSLHIDTTFSSMNSPGGGALFGVSNNNAPTNANATAASASAPSIIGTSGFGTPTFTPFVRARTLGGPRWAFTPYRMEALPIEEHALIGNMRTAAVVSTDGEIAWMCYPSFDSPSMFASILDREHGGRFKISVATRQGQGHHVNHRQLYHSETNVLITRYMTDTGVAQVQDYMPVGKGSEKSRGWLIREIEAVRGKMYIRVECCPAFDYGREKHRLSMMKYGAKFEGKKYTMIITNSKGREFKEHPIVEGGVYCDFPLIEGEKAVFIFREDDGKTTGDEQEHPPIEETDQLREKTMDYWRKWISKCKYTGRWREMVYRSALVLKLMQFEPTGAIVAAPTSSLPEEIGGVRNWDYRFTWIRDSSLVLSCFLKLGFYEEATSFWHWLANRLEESENTLKEERFPLQIMYSIHGDHHLEEMSLDHLSGYRNSAPVRIGNGAHDQLQLDIYGELLDAIYAADQHEPISYEFWRYVCCIVDWVCVNWTRTDESIWEVRGGRRHFTYSKVMLWVCVDRGIRIAINRSFPADLNRWRTVRDTIFDEIQTRAWNEKRKAFVQFYGSDTLDASVLIMPLARFCSPTDPRFVSTLDAILKNVSEDGLVSNNLVFRYNVDQTKDGLTGDEGTFSLCTFWAVEAAARLGFYHEKYLDKARLMFEQMQSFANHVGLFAEEIGHRGEHLGNFPQAFTHLSMAHATLYLDRALSGKNPNLDY